MSHVHLAISRHMSGAYPLTTNQLTSRIDNNTLTHTYQYDANGNQTQSTGNNARIIEYTPFNCR
jgi:YD repeat-containing protein